MPYPSPFNPGLCPPRKAPPVFVDMGAALKGCGSPQPEAPGTMVPTSNQVSLEGSCVSHSDQGSMRQNGSSDQSPKGKAISVPSSPHM